MLFLLRGYSSYISTHLHICQIDNFGHNGRVGPVEASDVVLEEYHTQDGEDVVGRRHDSCKGDQVGREIVERLNHHAHLFQVEHIDTKLENDCHRLKCNTLLNGISPVSTMTRQKSKRRFYVSNQ